MKLGYKDRLITEIAGFSDPGEGYVSLPLLNFPCM